MSENKAPFGQKASILEGCTLRALRKEDAEPAGEVLSAMDPWLTLGYSSQGLTGYLLRQDPALSRYIVEVGERAAGIVCIRYPWLLGPYIELLALYAPCRGMGLGRAILDWIESQAGPASKNIWALVSSFNESAVKFYGKSGFFQIAPLEDLVRPGYSEILLRKPIKR